MGKPRWKSMRTMIVILSTKLEIYLPSGNLTLLLKMVIEIVDLPIKNGDFPQLCKRLPEGIYLSITHFWYQWAGDAAMRVFMWKLRSSKHPKTWGWKMLEKHVLSCFIHFWLLPAGHEKTVCYGGHGPFSSMTTPTRWCVFISRTSEIIVAF